MSSGMDWGERQPSPALLWSWSGVSHTRSRRGVRCEVKSRYMQARQRRARLHDCVTCCVNLKRVKDVSRQHSFSLYLLYFRWCRR